MTIDRNSVDISRSSVELNAKSVWFVTCKVCLQRQTLRVNMHWSSPRIGVFSIFQSRTMPNTAGAPGVVGIWLKVWVNPLPIIPHPSFTISSTHSVTHLLLTASRFIFIDLINCHFWWCKDASQILHWHNSGQWHHLMFARVPRL